MDELVFRGVGQQELAILLSVPAPWTGVYLGTVLFALIPRPDHAARFQTALDADEQRQTPPPHTCPVCGWAKVITRDKRDTPNYIRRLRECTRCNARWSTREYTHRIVRQGDGTRPEEPGDTQNELPEPRREP